MKNEPPPPPPPPAVAEVAAPAPTPPPPPPPEPRSKVPAYVTGAVAIVAAGVGTGFGIKALGQSSDFKDRPTTKRADDGENNALVAETRYPSQIFKTQGLFHDSDHRERDYRFA